MKSTPVKKGENRGILIPQKIVYHIFHFIAKKRVETLFALEIINFIGFKYK